MYEIIKTLRDPHFKNKQLFLLLSPLQYLPIGSRSRICEWAVKHWEKAPTIMHRLYWVCRG